MIKSIAVTTILAPLVASIIAGFWGKRIGRMASHRITVLGVAIAFLCSLYLAYVFVFKGTQPQSLTLYVWAVSGTVKLDVAFLLDPLTVMMMVIVTFVSLLVHIYTIGYMAEDDGYQRFFAYISMFTFFMLMLVMANNFMQLFFGWEGVGLASYLLIGFWFKSESALVGSLKAFIVNRVGDFGFLLGIAAVLDYFGSLDYNTVFAKANSLVGQTITILPGMEWSVLSVICILLFIGAMGKSAQVPLHVWLPESMEGPTPISALIHAATMVTAGIFMVARMSPLFELSNTALSLVLVIGATGALFTGIIGIVQTDIKRVIAYSTLSQLGYMTAALGASAYAAGLFHLFTHACFKALLFLAAGSVILAMHHEQDMQKMGSLRKYMPITYVTFLIGALALSGIPPFAGFYSKDSIIDAIGITTVPGHYYAYFCVTLGAFVTALYSFRALFMTFHGKERMDAKTKAHLKESPWVVTLPLVVLAVPSVVLGFLAIGPLLYDKPTLFGQTLHVAANHNVMAELAKEYHGPWTMMLHSLVTVPFWFAIAGIVCAFIAYVLVPSIPRFVTENIPMTYNLFLKKYGFDDFNEYFWTRGTRRLSIYLFNVADLKFIDDFIINGSGRVVNWLSENMRRGQSGYLYHYAAVMVVGLLGFLLWLLL